MVVYVIFFRVLHVSARQRLVVFADSWISRWVFFSSHNLIVDFNSHRINHQLPTFVTMLLSALGSKQSKMLKVHLHLHRVVPFSLRLLSKGESRFILPTVRILILKFGEYQILNIMMYIPDTIINQGPYRQVCYRKQPSYIYYEGPWTPRLTFCWSPTHSSTFASYSLPWYQGIVWGLSRTDWDLIMCACSVLIKFSEKELNTCHFRRNILESSISPLIVGPPLTIVRLPLGLSIWNIAEKWSLSYWILLSFQR